MLPHSQMAMTGHCKMARVWHCATQKRLCQEACMHHSIGSFRNYQLTSVTQERRVTITQTSVTKTNLIKLLQLTCSMFVGVYQWLFSGLCDTQKRRLIRKSVLLGSSQHVFYSLISIMAHTTNLNIFIDTNKPYMYSLTSKISIWTQIAWKSVNVLQFWWFYSVPEVAGSHFERIYVFFFIKKHRETSEMCLCVFLELKSIYLDTNYMKIG